MIQWILSISLILNVLTGVCQSGSIAQMKTELEKSPNPPLYVKDILKKKFKLDTVMVTRTARFLGVQDSLAYRGVLKKVYGPYQIQNQKCLLQILARLPNTFYKLSQIFIDTSVFRHRIADSIGHSILDKLKNHQASFEQLSQTYSMGGEASTKGDLGWIAKGTILPAIDKQLSNAKKGDVFMVWSPNGLHIVKLTEGPKQDNGVALMMRILL